MWHKAIFLFILLKIYLATSQDISCRYSQTTPAFPYTCYLTINNPEGFDNFESIPGEHLAGRGNADVTVISAAFQNSTNIPSILCRQFPNIREVYMPSSGVTEISENSFSGCASLWSLTLVYNLIEDVPANTFRGNNQLAILNLAQNRISQINPESFTGSSIVTLDLSNNQISDIVHGTFAPLSESLVTLYLVSNQLTSLPEGAFGHLEQLETLHLSGNPLTAIPAILFRNLHNLRTLFMINCGISQPNPSWFNYLRSLTTIHLESNGITDLTEGLFARSRRLTNVYLAGNNITQLSVAPFGNNLPAMEIINLVGNAVRGIDRRFFDIAENLHTLYLNGNDCSNENLEYRFEDRDRIRERLERCFRGFGPEFIRCQYELNEDNIYGCHMNIRNPIGNEFNVIEGDHIGGQGNENIQIVDIIRGNTRNVPQIICQTFPQIRDLLLLDDFIEIINQQSFTACTHLHRLHLGNNLIQTVPVNTFANNQQLTEIYLGTNRITFLHPTSFSGTVLSTLDLSDNILGTINPTWFEPIATTLRNLDLINARITNVPTNAFTSLTRLNSLYLNSNSLTELNGDVFATLTDLRELGIGGCELNELNPQWFSTLSNLNRLYVSRNNLREFPENIFNSLPRLEEVFFYDNQIVNIREESFGASLPNIRLLYGSNNLINSFDPVILDRANELDALLLANNLCTNVYLHGIRGDLELVRERLETCTLNYQAVPLISCEYTRMITGRIYKCSMSAVNPLGSNDFERISGEHLVGANDDSVMIVEADNQNTRIIPSVICRQFRSMQMLDLLNSRITELTQESFQGCEFLRELIIMGNSIREIPMNAFAGARNHLQILTLSSNEIEEISFYAFTGTQIQELDLTHNRISRFDAYTYSHIGQTLRVLRLTDNRISSLPQNALDLLPNLVDLELNGNQIASIPHNVFLGATSLQILQITNNRIERLEPGAFSTLDNLVDLELSLNNLDLLPNNIFDLPNLRTLGLVQNRFRSLDAAAFGRSLASIIAIDVSVNRIDAFDPDIISEESNLRNLNLAYNGCSQSSFTNIPDNRAAVVNSLQACINNYNNVEISCEFEEMGETLYVCSLSIDNENDRLRFNQIEGEHLEGRSDSYVRSVSALDQNSRTIPSIICERFENIETIVFASSNLQELTPEAFRGCNMLFSLNVAGNNLVEIPERLFSNNPYLSVLNLANNRIFTLNAGIFEGTQVSALDLELNALTSFNPAWFDHIESTLLWLYLNNNQIRRFPSHAFSALNRLSLLEISGNDAFIPSNVFESLSHVYILHLANCGIRSLNHRWFDDLNGLTYLEIDSNEISELPLDIFDLPSLEHLGIAYNQIEVLNSRSFGGHINELSSLDAEFNRINAIDSRIIDMASSLDNLALIGNICANNNFMDVQENQDIVREYLEGCFNNFQEV